MNMWLNKKTKRPKTNPRRRVTLLALAIGIVIGAGIYIHYRIAGASTQSPEIFLTDLSGNNRSLFAPNEPAIMMIRVYGKNTPSGVPAHIDIYQKFPSMVINDGGTDKTVDAVTFDEVYSLTDKNGNSYTKPTPVSQGPNHYKFSLSDVSVNTNNYIELRLKIKMSDRLGSFDLTANYSNCNAGPPQKSGEDSRVEYVNSTNGDILDRIVFSAFCIKISKDSPYVIKTTYGSDPGNDPANTTAKKKATFEAGEDVWVVLEIYEPEGSRTDFKITDRVPGSISGSIKGAEFRNSSGELISLHDVSLTNGAANFNYADDNQLILLKGKNYIIYKYKI